MMAIDHLAPLERSIAETGARLDQLRERMRNTPICLRQNQAFLDMARERQRLLGQVDALRRLEQLAR